VNISDEARWAEKIQDLPDVRQDVVARIRAEIASGTYETEEKLNLAVERLLDEIG
jgi:negative regulator of flagellin synthesis FlgM